MEGYEEFDAEQRNTTFKCWDFRFRGESRGGTCRVEDAGVVDEQNNLLQRNGQILSPYLETVHYDVIRCVDSSSSAFLYYWFTTLLRS
jgi:hypothetical protein